MVALGKLNLRAVDAASLILAAAAALIVLGVLKDLALLAVGRDLEIDTLIDVLTLQSQTDSWMPMYRAVDFFRSTPDAGIYQTVFFEEQTKFQYPPTSLLPFLGLSVLGVDAELGYGLMNLLSILSLAGILAATAKLALDQARAPGFAPFMARPYATWMLMGGLIVCLLTFYPITYAYHLGQIQVQLDLAVCLAMLAWTKERKGVAGALMAAAALVKPQYALVFIWSLLRREHQFTKGFAMLGVPAGLLSLLIFGIGEHFDYLEVIAFIGRHGEIYWTNQTMNGLLNRLLVDADAMTWDPNAFAPHHPLVYAGTLLSTLALVLFALGYRPRWARAMKNDATADGAKDRESLLDLSTAIVALTLASPIAWGHHYGVTWPIMVVTLMMLADLHARRGDRLTLMLLVGLGASYFLVSNYLTQLFPFEAAPFNVLQSYVYAGGLGLLAVLVGARRALDPTRGERTRTAAAA